MLLAKLAKDSVMTKLGEAIASQAIAEVWPAAGMDQSGSVGLGRDAHSLCSRRSAKPDPFGCDSQAR
ncbi:MAG: hypothetical protein CR217_04075 [Beijerinckiaceae bacterium]|nr:MAG: hypothetical protein CR217_04075 [Beijerinckiaceae bacterium]